MARPTYEADRQVLMLRDLATGQVRPLTQPWDRSVGSIEWAKDGRSILVTAEDTLEGPVFRVDVASGNVTRLTGDGNYGNVHALGDGGVVATMNSIRRPTICIASIRAGGRRSSRTSTALSSLSSIRHVPEVQFQGREQ